MRFDSLIIPTIVGLISYNSLNKVSVEAPAPQVVVHYREGPTLPEAIEMSADAYGIDAKVLTVIAKKESSFGHPYKLYRFEPKMLTKLKKHPSYKDRSDSSLRMLASSHGAFHILGVTSLEKCGLHWSHLYRHKEAADCAAKIVSELHDRADGNLREVFKRYNGSGPMAERYASDAMARLQKAT